MPSAPWLQAGYADVRQHPPTTPVRRMAGNTMGTRWSLVYSGASACQEGQLRWAVQSALDTVVKQMSHWNPGSHISRFNRAAGGSVETVPQEFADVLACALQWARASGGAFDPTVGALVEAWGFGPCSLPRSGSGQRPPDAAMQAAARALTGWKRLEFDTSTRSLRQPGGLRLDLSGIAKGHAVDLACGAVSACGVDDFLMEIGGELRASGTRPGGHPWTIGVEQLGSALPLPLPLHNGMAVATSGYRWHAWEHAGRRYAHTLDPRIGAPVSHDLVSVTVVHEQCMQADALATTLLVLGPVEGPAFAAGLGIAACFVRGGAQRGSAHATPAFAWLL